MSLSDSKVTATIAVSDLDRAKQFYGGKLGLSVAGGIENAQVIVYQCGDGSELTVYQSEHAGKATATVATYDVDDIEATVDELTSNGVAFERYEEPMKTDEKGIYSSEEGRVAWFKDPDGNTIAVGQFG